MQIGFTLIRIVLPSGDNQRVFFDFNENVTSSKSGNGNVNAVGTIRGFFDIKLGLGR